jgi:ribose transport system permease protein
MTMATRTTVPLPAWRPPARDRLRPVLRLFRRIDWRQYVIYFVFAGIFIYFAVTLHQYGFLTRGNLLNILSDTAPISVMAVAMTFVIASAEIDLSVGSVASLSSVITVMALLHYGLAAGILAGLGIGLLIGAINGGLVTIVKIPSFLVTLGMLGIAQGIAMWITSEAAQPILDERYIRVFGGGDFGPIPSLVVWTAVFVVIGAFILRKTPFGRKVLATGGNRVAADYSGINTARIKFTVLMASGFAAAFAGMPYGGWLSPGRFDWGIGNELSVIAAVILGGTSLFGGNGSVIGALFGSLLMGMINNGLVLDGLGAPQQQVVRGAIIVFAVALGRRR